MRKILSFILLLTTVVAHAYDPSTDILLKGTFMSSPGKNPALAFDGNPDTYFSANKDEMAWVGMDLQDTCVITSIAFMPVNTSQGQDNMQLGLFEGANRPDFLDAVPLYFIQYKPTRGQYTTVNVEVSRGFRYVRYVGSSGSNCRVADISFYGHPGVGDDSRFYQITDLPTVSIHVQDEANPWNKGEEFDAIITNIYDKGTRIQQYPLNIRVRGNYSASHPNKPYRLKFTDGKKHHMFHNDSLRESPLQAKKWVLVNSYRDKTCLRNPIAWAVSKRINPTWTPWGQAVDLLLNGDYHGTYTLCDHVSVGKGRIDIEEMTEQDIEGEALTGGYFIEADNNYGGERYHWLSAHGNTMSLHSPDEEVVQPQQFEYIKKYFARFEDRLFGENYRDPELGYRSMLDLPSFLKWFLISEFNGNTDMICQVFMYKQRGDDHLYTGPVWDHELALENDQTVYPGNQFAEWTYTVRQTGQWGQVVKRVLSDPYAMAMLQEMWAEVRDDSLVTADYMHAMVDSFRVETRQSASLNFLRWPYLNQWLSLNPNVWGSWEAEMDNVQRYVEGRVAWIDNKLHYTSVDTIGNVYQIYTGRDFALFAQAVQTNKSISARLLADIDMSNYSGRFVPLGTQTQPFLGKIEGGGHTIDNLKISGKDNVALIAYSGAGCEIKNLTLGKGCTIEGANNVAGFVANVRAGTVNIDKCGFEGTINATEVHAAGFVASVRTTAGAKVTNSYNAGTISANNRAASFASCVTGKFTGENLFNVGKLTGVEEDHEFAFSARSASLTECYDVYAKSATQATPISMDSVSNGWLCYRLNGERSNGIWRQNLDNGKRHDAHPVFDTTHGIVYLEDGIYTNLRQMKESYQYYMLDVTATGGGPLQLSEFALLDESMNEIPLRAFKGPNGYGSETWDKLTDGRLDTKFCGSNVELTPFFFDAGTEVSMYGYRLYTANDTGNYPDRNPRTWRLYGSKKRSDNSNDASWELIDERTDDETLGATNFTPYDFLTRTPQMHLSLDVHNKMLVAGKDLQLNLTVSPDMYATARVEWSSSDANVATVDNGHVQALSSGVALIVACAPDFGNVADTCVVKVVDEGDGYQYFFFELAELQDGGTTQLSEFQLLTEENTVWPELSLYHFIGNAVATHPATDMFDGKTTTKYCGTKANGADAFCFFIDANAPIMPIAYRLITANDTQNWSGRNPLTWRLWASNESSTDPKAESWTLLDERINDHTMKAFNYTPYDFIIDYPTDIEQTEAEPIATPGAIYDLQGRRISKPRRGIYIISNKKILVQ